MVVEAWRTAPKVVLWFIQMNSLMDPCTHKNAYTYKISRPCESWTSLKLLANIFESVFLFFYQVNSTKGIEWMAVFLFPLPHKSSRCWIGYSFFFLHIAHFSWFYQSYCPQIPGTIVVPCTYCHTARELSNFTILSFESASFANGLSLSSLETEWRWSSWSA